MSRIGRALISSDDSTGAVTLPSAPSILPAIQGGFAKDMSAVTGVLTFNGGVCYEMTGTILPADATSTAVQAAIDSGAKKVYLDPAITYAFTSVVTLSRVSDDGGIEIDGQGATVTGDGVIANCFLVDGPSGTDYFNHVRIRNIVFGGTVTGSFVKVETGRTMWHQYTNLRTTQTADADALLEIHNESAAATPGGFVIQNLLAPSSAVHHTVLFSKEAAAAGDTDDFILDWLQGGDDSTVEVEDACNLMYASITNILTDSHGVRTVNTGTVQRSRIHRMYLEPTEAVAHYGVSGNFYHCDIRVLTAWVADHSIYPYASAPVFLVYGSFYDCSIGTIYLYSSKSGYAGPPYAPQTVTNTEYYPVISIIQGGRNVIDFPSDHMEYGMALGATATVWPITFVQQHVPRAEPVTNSLVEWRCANGHMTNYGQSGAAVITLPTAKEGMKVRFSIATAGAGAYSIKAAAGNKIILNGTALDDGDKVSNATPALGDSIVFTAFRSGAVSDYVWDYDWIGRSEGGTWSDGGA